MIGAGRADDPRRWVQAAYLLLDAIEDGLGDRGKLPTQAKVAAEIGVNRSTVTRAYQELADLGIVYLVPGLGYFATAG
jgi:DNA-binding GntR family transcriptional regulator